MAYISYQGELVENIHEHGINYKTREIFIAPTEPDGDVDCVMASQFIKNIQYLNSINDNPILIHIGTCGGDWNYGMAIYDAITASSSYITTLSYGHARSMSSIFPQAADKRVLTPHCDFMIHEGTFAYEGTSRGARHNTAWFCDKAMKTMMDIYTERCMGGTYFKDFTDRRVRTFLINKIKEKEDWFITAQDAVKYGFMDGILGEQGFENTKVLLTPEG